MLTVGHGWKLLVTPILYVQEQQELSLITLQLVNIGCDFFQRKSLSVHAVSTLLSWGITFSTSVEGLTSIEIREEILWVTSLSS